MSNVLSDDKKQQVIALGRLGWSLRRIEAAVHIRRETIAGYLRAVGIAVRPPGGWGRLDPAKPANEVINDFAAGLAPVTELERKPIVHPSASISATYREAIDWDSRVAATPWRFGRTWLISKASRPVIKVSSASTQVADRNLAGSTSSD